LAFLSSIADAIRHPLDSKYYPIWNGLAFQVAWPACVLGGNAIAALVTTLFVAGHLCVSSKALLEFKFILLVGLIGLAVDMTLIKSGTLIWDNIMPPVWMSCLWILFGGTVGHSFKWFERHLLLSFFFAGMFAPLSYLAGTRLTSVGLQEPQAMSLVIIGAAWSILFPCFLITHKHLVKSK
jgi:hypothetical protein